MLVPLALLWGLEERLRARELQNLRREQRWRPQSAVAGQQWDESWQATECLPERPLSLPILAGWLAASAMLLWLLMEALLL